jgi:hypothetical protein
MARKSRKSLSLFQRIWSPVNEAVRATGNSARNVSRSVGSIAGTAVNTVSKVGSRYAKAANRAVSNITSRKNNKSSRRNKSTRRRKSRR